MKTLQQRINERLVLSKNKYKLTVKTLNELQTAIIEEIKRNGPNCSLNHIDVSKITDMHYLFNTFDNDQTGSDENSKILKSFNGDISKWDVSNVTDMSSIFLGSEFTGENGDISGWDVVNVENMKWAFASSMFTGDISEWDVSSVKSMAFMFAQSNFDGDISNWNVSNVKIMQYMFAHSKFNGDISKWDVSDVTDTLNMFVNCPLENKPPKWYKK